MNPSLQCTARLNNHGLALLALWGFGGLTEALMEMASGLAPFLEGEMHVVCLSSHCQYLRNLAKFFTPFFKNLFKDYLFI